jgi:carbon-monoxide dehydrogenase medium subunit
MPAINMRLNAAACLIDLNRIESMRGITLEGDHLVIGAMTTHAAILASELVREHVPVLIHAGRHLAHTAIRNRGTMGGSLALFDAAAEWPAACILVDAQIRVEGPDGVRHHPAESFVRGLFNRSLGEDELITAILLPKQCPTDRSVVLELARRQGDFASAALMATVRSTAGKPTGLRMVFFGVSDLPRRFETLESQLLEAIQTGDLTEVAALTTAALLRENVVADLYHSVEMKRHLCGVLAGRALRQLLVPETSE